VSEQLSITMEAIERRAAELLPPALFERWFGKLGHPLWMTETNNVSAFSRYYLRPRVLTGVSNPDLSVDVLGERMSLPVMLGPTGLQGRFHPDAEIASARAAAGAQTALCLSAGSTFSIEDVAAAAPSCLTWFQLYLFKDVDLTNALVNRAEAAGYKVIVITVDNPAIPTHERDGIAQLVSRLPRQPEGLSTYDSPFGNTPQFKNVEEQLDAYELNVTWTTIDRIRAWTSLPVVIKGIQTVEDAQLAVDHGAAGIVVSNHGGHALMGAQATLDQLGPIADAVGADLEVYLDGGIRRGTDVLKAMALGARAVLVGRAQYWGLAMDGEAGVRTMLEMLREELRIACILCGIAQVRQIGAESVTNDASAA
jgi:isopentenyl diphosphate isomerase/L-lactate dehydrogenase-like FMN-dependent dehydrogenase